MSLLDDFRTKYDVNNLSILVTKYWTLSIRPQQLTFGSLLISSNKNNCTCFSDLKFEELQDLHSIYGFLNMLQIRLNSEKINYYSLMMIDKHLHSHVFFRYSCPTIIGSNIYTDEYFPGLLDFDSTLPLDPLMVKATLLELIL